MPSAVPLKPIVGMFKKRIIRDVTIGLVAGSFGSYLFWEYGYGVNVRKTEAYYKKLQESEKAF
ncbi:hypothetical protein BB558_004147 [Smittium angustum]|nr:hypothetical protein BB558_006967 [Smittium angustum]PVZ99815.1 hypothetical protein BB558_004147 [Smittium angustum]